MQRGTGVFGEAVPWAEGQTTGRRRVPSGLPSTPRVVGPLDQLRQSSNI